MSDRRFKKTEKSIVKGFYRALKSKNLSKITVTEIAQEADIGRGTFYLHYLDVYDLYERQKAEVCDNLVRIFKSCYPSYEPENQKRIVECLIDYIWENRENILLLAKVTEQESLTDRLRGTFNREILHEDSVTYRSEYDRIEADFIVGGIISTLNMWIADELRLSKEDMTDYLELILYKFIA